MNFQQELAAKASTQWALAAVEGVCGLAARKLMADKLRQASPIQQNLIQNTLASANNDTERAYLLIETLLTPTYVRTLWPHMTLSERDVRNKLRALLPNLHNATVGGWGYSCTYNPILGAGTTLPMLVHAFSVQKEVDATDGGWTPYVSGPGLTPNKRTARPVLRSLDDPLAVVNLVLSCSLLSNTKCSTASPVGWVINAPVWNIFGFAPRDVQFPNDSARHMGALQQAKGITKGPNNLALTHAYDSYPSLAQIITQTHGQGGESHYNEIVVLGRSQLLHTDITVTGIFVKVCTHNGSLHLVDAIEPGMYGYLSNLAFYANDQVIDAIRTCAQTHHLPIVPLLDPSMQDLRTDRLFTDTFHGLTVTNDWNCPLT
ncbi:hypothetical protein ACM792_24000 [Metapseudomonas otitidis]|uniref:hypothetical protein n=1 Tax=Metapseudomonas otitidis TaxID=319939 RepID=UPI0039FBE86C